MICFGWKWLGSDKVYTYSLTDDMKRFKKDPSDDFSVVKRLYDVIKCADIIVGHNMAGFDWKKFYARVIYYGLPPIAKPEIVDTLKQARKLAYFTSNKMAYLTKHLRIGEKPKHSSDMWLRILRGDAQAVQEAAIYCSGDVIETEKMYQRLLPYMEDHPNVGLWRADGIDACRNCGSDHLAVGASRVTKSGKYKRYQCQDCGCWMKGKAEKIAKVK